MELCPATIPDLGRETAAARHCQVVLKQHQLPFSRSPNAIKLHPQDLVVDAAHFATLYTNGHSESVIANTIELQLLHSESNTPPTAWSSTFTTCLALATEATFLWGCTGLTWVTQYPHYISSDNADALLGSTAFHLGLQSRLWPKKVGHTGCGPVERVRQMRCTTISGTALSKQPMLPPLIIIASSRWPAITTLLAKMEPMCTSMLVSWQRVTRVQVETWGLQLCSLTRMGVCRTCPRSDRLTLQSAPNLLGAVEATHRGR
eukprot:1721716-Rhodomonas_salina.1